MAKVSFLCPRLLLLVLVWVLLVGLIEAENVYKMINLDDSLDNDFNRNATQYQGKNHFIISFQSSISSSEDSNPVEDLHEKVNLLVKSISNSRVIYIYENLAKYLKIFIFSVLLESSDDLGIIGDLLGKDIKQLEAVDFYFASELVTDVSNLAHGLPYRQVLKRPFREADIISGDKAQLQDITCAFEENVVDELTHGVYMGHGNESCLLETSEPKSSSDVKQPDAPVIVFVLDTGIQANHKWFKDGQINYGFDFENNIHQPFESHVAVDMNGHGTKVAGIIGGITPKLSRYSNCTRSSKIISVRVLDSNGQGKTDDIVAGLDYVVGSYFEMKRKNPRTANSPQRHLPALAHMSFSGKASSILARVIDALAKLMPVVGASGDNDSFSCWTTPADSKNAIVVGATMRESNLPLGGSNYGECISVNAPGQEVPVPVIGESSTEEGTMTGSSASAARISSVIVTALSIIDTNRSLYTDFYNKIAEVDVSVFLKTILTESLSPNSRIEKSDVAVHMEGHVPCSIISPTDIGKILQDRLSKTISKSFIQEDVYYDNGFQPTSPVRRLRDRYRNLKKDSQP